MHSASGRARALEMKGFLSVFDILPRPLLPATLLALLALSFPGCRDGAEKKAEEKPPEGVLVEVATLATGEIRQVVRGSTTLEAESEVKVLARTANQASELLVEEGDPVEKGQLLARLESDQQRRAVAKTEAQLARARKEFERTQNLHHQEMISTQALNDASFELRQLEIALEDAKLELSYTEITAPIRGTLTQRLLKAGDQVAIGQHLFDLVDFDTLVARVYLPEKNLPLVKEGMPARLLAPSLQGQEFSGKVSQISPIIDPRSGTFKVTVRPDRPASLRPGLFMDVEITTSTHSDAVLIPKRALAYDGSQLFVFHLEGNAVRRLIVQAQLEDANFVEPLSGFAPGMRIVVAGQSGLKDGALVRLLAEDSADQSGQPAVGPSGSTER
jgi:membrane fusion protein (multidrug efflux system)